METHRLLLDEAGFPIVYVRTPLLPYEVAWKLYTPDWQAALKELLQSHHELRLAIRVASPPLARELAKWLAGEEVSARARRRLLAYALRASTRTTPFGLFAAISRVTIGEQANLEIEAEMHTRTRVDMGWLAGLISQWRDEPEFRKKIRVAVNDAMLRRGDRYTAYHPLHAGQIGEKIHAYKPMTFTATDAVRFLESEAQSPATMQELAKRLQEQYDEPPEECFRLLEELWHAGFFVDELVINPTAADPSREVLERVEARDAGRAADATAVVDAIARLDMRPLSARTSRDYDAIDAMQVAIFPGAERALQTDAVRGAKGALPAAVLDDVRLLAQLMLRGPALTHLAYRKRFIERYEGTTREVPLLELVHPSFGLGVPESPERDSLPSDLVERQMLVASEALRDGQFEVNIEGEHLDALMPRLEESRLATSFDFGFEVVASSYEAMCRGDYLIAKGAFSYAARAGAAVGRFADALGELAQSDLRAIASQLEALQPDVIVAELVALPTWARGLNVCIRPVMHAHRVQVGFMKNDASESNISLDDLVVGLDGTGFYVRSVSLGKRIVLTESHVLNTPKNAPTISRLLSQLVHEDTVFPREYSWDCRVPFRPRIRSGRVILRKAAWRFTRVAIAEAVATSFSAFAKSWAMPRFVDLVTADNRLLIDTTSEVGPQLLLDHVRPEREIVTLEEALFTPETVWFRDQGAGAGFRAEFIASFGHASAVERKMPTFAPVVRHERILAPGSDWLYFKVYGDKHDDDRLLGGRIAPLLQRLVERGAIEQWYFLRYADPRAHLRVRMKVANGELPTASKAIHELLASLTHDGTVDSSVITTYEREIERYGGPEGMRSCEAIFAADSAHVVRHVVNEKIDDPDERVAFVARTIVEMALECAEAAETFDPRSLRSDRASLGDADRQSARTIKQLVGGARFIGPDLCGALRELVALDAQGKLTRAFVDVFDSVVHMHANRCALNDALERRARTLARQVLQGLIHVRAG